jgi:hypothetical protein
MDGATETRLDALDAKIDSMQVALIQRLDEIAAALEEGYRNMKTELLKAFYTMGQTIQARMDTQETAITGLQRRQALLEARLLEIEKRLNLPPAS